MTEKTAARSKPRRITDYCAALVFYFQHILKFLFSGKMIATVIGNLDPWYLLGPWYLWKNRKESKKLKASLIVISIFFLYGILQLIVFPNMSILKLAVTLLKLAVCILCMLYVMENAEKINFLRIAKIISVFYGITLPFALFFNQSPLFWITNDYVNKYTTTRLRLFYYEPSELGFRLIIVMVVLIGFFLASKCKKEKVLLAVLILVDAFTLYLARSMGAIGIGALAIGVMFLYD